VPSVDTGYRPLRPGRKAHSRPVSGDRVADRLPAYRGASTCRIAGKRLRPDVGATGHNAGEGDTGERRGRQFFRPATEEQNLAFPLRSAILIQQ